MTKQTRYEKLLVRILAGNGFRMYYFSMSLFVIKTENMEMQKGYYYVIYSGQIEIAEWDGVYFYLTGNENGFEVQELEPVTLLMAKSDSKGRYLQLVQIWNEFEYRNMLDKNVINEMRVICAEAGMILNEFPELRKSANLIAKCYALINFEFPI